MANLTSDAIFESNIPSAEAAIEAFILICICLVAVVANVSLWLVILTTRDLRTESNVLILCLSLADLLVSAVSMPITVATIIASQWQFSSTFCTVMGYINMLAFVTSVESLGVISINRYMKICRPSLFVSIYSYTNVFLMFIGVWTVSGALSAPPLVGWAVYAYLPYASICFCDWSVSLSYAVFMIGVCFCLPCLIMTLCYISILKTFFQSKKTIQAFSEPAHADDVTSVTAARKNQALDTSLQATGRKERNKSKKLSPSCCFSCCSLGYGVKQSGILCGREEDTFFVSREGNGQKISNLSSSEYSTSTASGVSTSAVFGNVIETRTRVVPKNNQTSSSPEECDTNLSSRFTPNANHLQISKIEGDPNDKISVLYNDEYHTTIGTKSGTMSADVVEKCDMELSGVEANTKPRIGVNDSTNYDMETTDDFYSGIRQEALINRKNINNDILFVRTRESHLFSDHNEEKQDKDIPDNIDVNENPFAYNNENTKDYMKAFPNANHSKATIKADSVCCMDESVHDKSDNCPVDVNEDLFVCNEKRVKPVRSAHNSKTAMKPDSVCCLAESILDKSDDCPIDGNEALFVCNENIEDDTKNCGKASDSVATIKIVSVVPTDKTIDKKSAKSPGNKSDTFHQFLSHDNHICEKPDTDYEEDINFQTCQDLCRRNVTMETHSRQRALANKMSNKIDLDNSLEKVSLKYPMKCENTTVDRSDTDCSENNNNKKHSSETPHVKNINNFSFSQTVSPYNNNYQKIDGSLRPGVLKREEKLDLVSSSTQELLEPDSTQDNSSPLNFSCAKEAEGCIDDEGYIKPFKAIKTCSYSMLSSTQTLTTSPKKRALELMHENPKSKLDVNTSREKYLEESDVCARTLPDRIIDTLSVMKESPKPGITPIKSQDNLDDDSILASRLPAGRLNPVTYVEKTEEALIAKPCTALSVCETGHRQDTAVLSLGTGCTQFSPDSGHKLHDANQKCKKSGRKIDNRKLLVGFPLLFYYESQAASQLWTINEEEETDAFPFPSTKCTNTALNVCGPYGIKTRDETYEGENSTGQNLDDLNSNLSNHHLMEKQDFNQQSRRESKDEDISLESTPTWVQNMTVSLHNQRQDFTMSPNDPTDYPTDPEALPERINCRNKTGSIHKRRLGQKQSGYFFRLGHFRQLLKKHVRSSGLIKAKVHPIDKKPAKDDDINVKHKKGNDFNGKQTEEKNMRDDIQCNHSNRKHTKDNTLNEEHRNGHQLHTEDTNVCPADVKKTQFCPSNSNPAKGCPPGLKNIHPNMCSPVVIKTGTCKSLQESTNDKVFSEETLNKLPGDLSKGEVLPVSAQPQPSTATTCELETPQNSDTLHTKLTEPQTLRRDNCDSSSESKMSLLHPHQYKARQKSSLQSRESSTKLGNNTCSELSLETVTSSESTTSFTSSSIYHTDPPFSRFIPVSPSNGLPSPLESDNDERGTEFMDRISGSDECSSLQVRIQRRSTQKRDSKDKIFFSRNRLAPPKLTLRNRKTNHLEKRKKEEYQLTASLLVVIVIFIICWFPYCISMFVSIFSPHLSSRGLDMTSLLLGYLNSCVNPIVYGLMNKRFRSGYRKLFSKSVVPFKRSGNCIIQCLMLCNKPAPKTRVTIVVSST